MRRTLRAIAVAGTSTVLAIGGAVSASAVGPCDSGAFCAYAWAGFATAGPHYEWQGSSNGWGSGVANNDSSVISEGTSGLAVQVYDYNGYLNRKYCLYSGHNVAQLPSAAADDGQSHQWLSPSGLTCY